MWNNTQNYQNNGYQEPIRTKQNVSGQLRYLAQQMHQPMPHIIYSDNIGGYLYNVNLGLGSTPYTVELPSRILFCSENLVQGVLSLIIGRRANMAMFTKMKKQLYIMLGCLLIIAILMLFHLPILLRLLIFLIYLACYAIFPHEYYKFVFKSNRTSASIIGVNNIIKALEYENRMLKQDKQQAQDKQIEQQNTQNNGKFQNISKDWVNQFTQFVDVSPEKQIEELKKE